MVLHSHFQIDAEDKLPKILCAQCLQQVETIAKFRETCINAQTMLESCLNSSKLRNGGKVCCLLGLLLSKLVRSDRC